MQPFLHLLVLGLAIAAAGTALGAEGLRVVATTPDLAAVARAVGGDNIEVAVLARPTEDAHFVDPRPSFIRIVNQADVLIEGGASLEAGWLPPILDSARNARIATGAPGRVAAAQGLSLIELPAQLDRSLGDVHPQGNPHFMLDPVAAKTVAHTVEAAFCAVDAPRCSDYEAGLRRFHERIDLKLADWQAILAPYKGTKVVTYHKGFEYFLRRFAMESAGSLEPRPGIPPSPTHLTQLVPKIRAERVRLIVIEPFRERANPDFVAEQIGARVLALPTMPGAEGGAEYVDWIDHNVRRLAEALGPEPAP